MIAVHDEFERHARVALKNEPPELLDRLLVLRKEIQNEGDKAWSKARPPTASMLNAANRRMMDQAASLLGAANFERVFGFAPDQKYDIVDPRMMRATKSVTKTPDKPSTTRLPAARSPRSLPGPAVVTLRHLAAALAADHALSKRHAENILGDVVARIAGHLKKGERVRLGGLGVLQVRKRAARMGRNPATGEKITIKASKKVAFRTAKDLKESI